MFRAIAGSVRGWMGDSRLWSTSAGRKTVSSEVVTEETALNYSAVWCATRLLCGTSSSLPFPVYSGVNDVERMKERSHPVHRLLNVAPNPEMTAYAFRAIMWQWQVNWGNAYAEIQREGDNPEGDPVALWPLHPSRVDVMRDERDELYYHVRNSPGTPDADLSPWQVLHIPSIITTDGICGRGVIAHARECIGAGIAMEKYGANWFGGGAVPRVVIKHPGSLNDAQRKSFREEWADIYADPTGQKVALLGGGAEPVPITISAEDSQFLGSRQFTIEEIARWYGVPPHMLQHLLRATFSNIEHLGIEFVQYSLIPWLRIWEQSVNAKLLSGSDFFAEHNVDALLRGDSASRAAFYHQGILDGWLNRNEVRKLENLPPVPGGDTFLMQGAMVPIGDDGAPLVAASDVTSAPPPEAASGADEIATVAGSATSSVQATALNGAQVVALLELLDKLSMGSLPQEGSRAVIMAAYPGMDRGLIDKFVDDIASFAGSRPRENLPPDDTQTISDRLKSRAHKLLQRDLSRMLTKETNAVMQIAKNDAEFVTRTEDFYAKHRLTVANAIAEPVAALNECGAEIDTAAFVASWIQTGKSSVLEVSGTVRTKEELAAAVKGLVESDAWLNRPAVAT